MDSGGKIDWAKIEADYRTGEPVGAIAARHGVTRQGIYRRAAEHSWPRDMSRAVERERKRRLLKMPADRGKSTAEPCEEDLQAAVDTAAGTQVAIVTAHQAAAAALRQTIAAQIDELAGSKEKLPVRASTARQLAASLSSVVDVERRAHGITDDGGETDSYEARLRKLLEESQA